MTKLFMRDAVILKSQLLADRNRILLEGVVDRGVVRDDERRRDDRFGGLRTHGVGVLGFLGVQLSISSKSG